MDAGPMASVTRTSCEDQVWGLKYACLPAMMWNHIGCFCFDFSSLCVYKCYFKLLAWEDIYIFTVIAFCLNILRCVFSVFKWLEDKLSHWLHLSNFSDMRKLLYNICTFSRNEAFIQGELVDFHSVLSSQVSFCKSEGWVKIYNVKMVKTEMAGGPPKICRNQKSFWIPSN